MRITIHPTRPVCTSMTLMRADDVALQAKAHIADLEGARREIWQSEIDLEKRRREFWRLFFPWLKPLTDWDARGKIYDRATARGEPVKAESCYRETLATLRALLDLCEASSDNLVVLTHDDLNALTLFR